MHRHTNRYTDRQTDFHLAISIKLSIVFQNIHTLLGSESLSGSSTSPPLPSDEQSIEDPEGEVGTLLTSELWVLIVIQLLVMEENATMMKNLYLLLFEYDLY